MSWSVVVAFMLTAALVGRVADALLHNYYNKGLKNWLYLRAIQFDEYTYIQLAHKNIVSMRLTIAKLFGYKLFSIGGLGVATILLFASIFFGYPMAEASGRWSNYDTHLYCAIIFLLSVGLVRISVAFTRLILSRIKPKITSLLFWIVVDILFIIIATPIPVSVASFLHALPKMGIDGAMQMMAFSAIISYAYLLGPIFNPEVLAEIDLSSLFLTLLVLTIGAPTIYHLLLVARDIMLKMVFHPIAQIISKLFEYIEREKQPLTWVLTILGAIPSVVKSWSELL